jgi:uncharacterized protein (TIGR03089 family)
MVRTFPAALQAQVARGPGIPLVTFYDDATGERVELSFATYANWVAKTGSLLQDELGLARGSLVAIDLPTHWVATVWLGAAWSVGVAAGDASVATDADLVVCGPHGLEAYSGGSVEVVACSLLPMGARFRTPLPSGVTDFGEVVWSQPDSLVVLDPVSPDDAAWTDVEGTIDHRSLLQLPDAPSGRIATDVAPASRGGVPRFVGPMLSGAGTVWVAGVPTPDRLVGLTGIEHAVLDAGGA